MDLTRKSFRNADDILFMLEGQLSARWHALDAVGQKSLVAELQVCQIPYSVNVNQAPNLNLAPERLRDSQKLKHLAVALHLPPSCWCCAPVSR